MAFFPGKEEFIWLERNILPRQHRIYPDACDYGIFEDEIDLDKTRRAVNELITCFKSPEYGYEAHTGYAWKEVKFYIPIEHDDGRVIGYRVQISGCKGPGIKRPFISIDFTHMALPPSLKF